MHAAQVDRSPRLQRVLAVLEDGREHSTRDILATAEVCAVNSIIAEIRANSYRVTCRQVPGLYGRVWLYRLVGASGSLPSNERRKPEQGEDRDA